MEKIEEHEMRRADVYLWNLASPKLLEQVDLVDLFLILNALSTEVDLTVQSMLCLGSVDFTLLDVEPLPFLA